MASDFQKRDVTLLHDTLSLICHTIWNSGKPPDGKHLWSIPPDRERDFDCILSDGITELVHLREENARLRAEQKKAADLFWPHDGDGPDMLIYEIRNGKTEAYVRECAQALAAALRAERGTE